MSNRRRFVKQTMWALAGSGLLQTLTGCVCMGRTAHLIGAMSSREGDDLAKIQELINGKVPIKWLFTGDSITQGAKHTLGYRSYPEIFGERIRWEMKRVRDFVINTAISGNTSRDILNDYDWRIGQFQPTIVSLMIGTNDASEKKEISINQFGQYNLEILTRIRQMGAIPILQTPNITIAEKAAGRERLPEYIAATRELAEQKKVVLIDHWSYWNEETQAKGKQTIVAKWLNDELHPNGYGHLKMAQLIFQKLSIFDPNSFTCKDLNS